jgi:voltage-gated potassium channel
VEVLELNLKKGKKSNKIKRKLLSFFDLGVVDFIITLALVLSLLLLFADTIFTIGKSYKYWVDKIETGITVFFLFEYLLRFYAAPFKRKFFFGHIIDLLAIVPLFRFFRLFMLLRVLKFLKSSGLRKWLVAISHKSKFFTINVEEKFFEFVILAFIFFCLLFVGSLGIISFEKGINDQFTSFQDGLWWTVVTLTTVGYGDKFPITIPGKILAIGLMFTGLSFFALITGFFSQFILDKYSKGENKGMDLASISNHILVCGYNSNTKIIMEELNDLYKEDEKVKVIISEQKPDIELGPYASYLKGDFSKMDVLETAQLSKADTVIVLADKSSERSDQDVDARTILTVLSIKKAYPDVYVCAEVISKENLIHIVNVGADEYISSSNYTGNLIAHSVANKGISRVYTELLSSNVGNKLVKTTVNERVKDDTFDNCSKFYMENENSILIGVERSNKFMINPGHDFVMTESDKVVLIA